MPTISEPQAVGPAASPSEDRATYLRALYGSAEPGLWFVVTTFPDGKSRAFPAADPSIDKALEYIESVDDGETHVFTSMGLFDAPPERGRGTAADVRALTTLWIDVDIKPTASASMDVARRIVDAIPLRPSLLTCSGAGLHAYYILSEPLSLQTDAERADVLDLLARWKATVLAYAAECGGAVDKGTFDVSRVMRVSGTMNSKSRPPLPAYIIEDSGLRYAESDFDPFLRDAIDPPTSAPTVSVTLSGAVAPSETLPPVFVAALDTDDRLRSTWMRANASLTDQSSSSYCLSLANQCVPLGLTDDQIAEILCTWRHAQGAVEKRPKWYADTIAKARSGGAISSAAAQFITETAADASADRQALLDGMSEMIGVRIDRIVRYGGVKRATYRVVFEGRDEQEIGDADDFLNQRKWSAPIADALSRKMTKMKPPVWDQFTTAALKVVEDVDRDEMSERALASAWVQEYLEARKLDEKLTAFEAYSAKRPFVARDGRIRIYFTDLLRSINKPGQRPIDAARDYNPAMRLIGAEVGQADLRKQGIRGEAARVWVLPHGFGEVSDE